MTGSGISESIPGLPRANANGGSCHSGSHWTAAIWIGPVMELRFQATELSGEQIANSRTFQGSEHDSLPTFTQMCVSCFFFKHVPWHLLSMTPAHVDFLGIHKFPELTLDEGTFTELSPLFGW